MSCPKTVPITATVLSMMTSVDHNPSSPPQLSPEAHFSLYNYLHHDVWTQFGDPRINQFPLFKDGPWNVILIIFCYLAFVTFIGPNFMRNRKPFEMKKFVLNYNIFMVMLNGYMFIHGMFLTNYGLDAWGCQTVETTRKDAGIERIKLTVGYMFFMSKIIELMDTIIFVLRKSWRQISTLHVIHHSLVPILMWIGFKLSPGGNAVFFPLINALIHTIMYTYYALSTMGPSFRRYLWWKKYLTKIQMVQFIFVIIHSLHVLFIPSCNFPKLLLYLAVSNAFLFLVLFYSFYVHTYKVIESKSKARICIKSIRNDNEDRKDVDAGYGSMPYTDADGDAHVSRKRTPMTTRLATMCFPELNNNQDNQDEKES